MKFKVGDLVNIHLKGTKKIAPGRIIKVVPGYMPDDFHHVKPYYVKRNRYTIIQWYKASELSLRITVKKLNFVVVDTKTIGPKTPILGRFSTHNEAADYIGTLPEHETGRYGLDPPTITFH